MIIVLNEIVESHTGLCYCDNLTIVVGLLKCNRHIRLVVLNSLVSKVQRGGLNLRKWRGAGSSKNRGKIVIFHSL